MNPTLTGVAELTMRLITAVGLGAAFGYTGVVWGTPLAWAGAVLLLVPAYERARRQLVDEPQLFIGRPSDSVPSEHLVGRSTDEDDPASTFEMVRR
jgi:hypothetical protein